MLERYTVADCKKLAKRLTPLLIDDLPHMLHAVRVSKYRKRPDNPVIQMLRELITDTENHDLILEIILPAVCNHFYKDANLAADGDPAALDRIRNALQEELLNYKFYNNILIRIDDRRNPSGIQDISLPLKN